MASQRFGGDLYSGSELFGAGDAPEIVAPGAASLTLTGPAPTLAQSGNVNLTPGAATLTLAGPAPVLAQGANQAFTPGAAVFTLSGPSPTITQGALGHSQRFAADLISGAQLFGAGGLGVLGSEVPATGDDGPGFLYNDLDPADLNREVRGRITRAPLNGTLTAYEDSSFVYAGTTDYFLYQPSVDGVDVGSPVRVDLNIGGASLIPGAASLTLSGPAPGVVVDVRLTPAAAALSLTGPAPTVLVTASGSQSITPGAAQIVLSGPAPAVLQTRSTTVGGGKGTTPKTPKGGALTSLAAVSPVVDAAPASSNQQQAMQAVMALIAAGVI